MIAEATAQELGGRISLEEAVRLVFLYAEKDRARFERAALRWHARYLAEAAPAATSSRFTPPSLTPG
jgi:hypothetical protein